MQSMVDAAVKASLVINSTSPSKRYLDILLWNEPTVLFMLTASTKSDIHLIKRLRKD